MAGDQQFRNARNRTYLARDFDSFRADLLRYSRTYFGDKIQDFSEASVGGLFLDMAATVADSMSFYMDHQFRELGWSTAIEIDNVSRMLQEAGVKASGASPSSVTVTIFLEVPSKLVNGNYVPDPDALPRILQSTILASSSGISFATTEDIDFAEIDRLGNLKAAYVVGDVNSSNNPISFILKKDVVCTSGNVATETFTIGNSPSPFFTLTLNNTDVSTIMSVIDAEGNEYYEVQALSQDTIFRTFPNLSSDSEEVSRSMDVIPAPRRFVTISTPSTRTTSLQFGGGTALTTEDDAIPDPETLAIPLYGKTTLSRFSLDPNSLLQTKTLGILPSSTTLSVTYRYGGGLSHNVASKTIRAVQLLRIQFPDASTSTVAANVRASMDVRNDFPARGGDNALTLEQLRSQIPSARSRQDRIVTKEDLVARVYTLPSKLGRVYRAGVRPNPNNPLSSQIYVCTKDVNGHLTTATDTLKKNLRTYLNEFRLINDAIDILDTRVINFRVRFSIIVNPNANKPLVLQSVINSLVGIMTVNNFQIDQPILISDIQSAIINSASVLSLVDLKIENVAASAQGRTYSVNSMNVGQSTVRGAVYGPPGSIFELKYPNYDIIGSAL
jgi:hypothetical protein